MHAEDMSIFWNQNKGQYESNGQNFYANESAYTRTADQRLKYKESTTYSEEKDTDDTSCEEAVKLESWLGTFILMLIPVVNVITILKLAISSKSQSKKSFARAILLLSLILLTLTLIFMVLTCDKIDYKSFFDTGVLYCTKLLGTIKRLF